MGNGHVMLKLIAATRKKVRISEEPINNCGKNVTENRSRVKLLFAICPITAHSSRAVLFPIESTEIS